MPGTGDINPRSRIAATAVSASLIALRPRQVLLAEAQQHSRRKNIMEKKPTNKDDQEQRNKSLLIHSVLRFLDRNGFRKTLKRFISESEIQGDDWKAGAVELEDVFHKYISSCDIDGKPGAPKEHEQLVDSTTVSNGDTKCAASDTFDQKKKKKRSEVKSEKTSDLHDEDDCKVLEHDLNKSSEAQVEESTKKSKDKKKKKSELTADSLDGSEKNPNVLVSPATESKQNLEALVKSKDEKKKNKPRAVSHPESEGEYGLEKKRKVDNENIAIDLPSEENNVKSKKKRKGHSVSEDSSVPDVNLLDKEKSEPAKNSNETSEDGGTSKKDVKKRKRLSSDENENQPSKETVFEESKRRKTEGVKETKSHRQANGKDENVQLTGSEPKTVSGKQSEVKTNVEISSPKNLTKTEQNGSAEPKTVKAFQRVKIDQVQFADERLQDNSYWAKDGAEIGYGAKAQEVLGQVKGRDFRHEKTKKKRGSYRGGQIDLQSHSIKFNYSDEE